LILPTSTIFSDVTNARPAISVLNSTQQALGDQGMLPPTDLSGGTFALSNIGVVGGTYMTPLLVVPQVAIGALGALKKRGRYNSDDELVPTWIMEVRTHSCIVNLKIVENGLAALN
jgi:hypothetical protein